jgi:hypothetical protein
MRPWTLLALGALLLGLPGCGDRTPCEADVDCVILCSCANGSTASGSGYSCQAGGCGNGHLQERDCVDICSRVGSVPAAGDDDDATVDDDDSGSGDDDSGGAR